MKILVDEKRRLHPYLEGMKKVATGIYAMLGSKAEVIIHDLSTPESSLFYIAGELTKRKLGAPATDVILRALRNKDFEDILNYQSKGKEGHIYKSSAMFLRDESGEVIGCLGINYDITDMLLVNNIINDFCATIPQKDEKEQEETFVNSINEVLMDILEKSKKRIGKPIPFMNKEDKLEVIKYLDERGCFLIKGAIEVVADDLRVSRYTIYNYLKEID